MFRKPQAGHQTTGENASSEKLDAEHWEPAERVPHLKPVKEPVFLLLLLIRLLYNQGNDSLKVEENGRRPRTRSWTSLLYSVRFWRAEGLLFLHGLESNPGSSLQTEEEAGLP